MPENIKIGCTRPSAQVEENLPKETEAAEKTNVEHKEEKHMIRVGKAAPDFVASGYQKGEFINLKLSDYKGKWVVLCFYPGDFTFV